LPLAEGETAARDALQAANTSGNNSRLAHIIALLRAGNRALRQILTGRLAGCISKEAVERVTVGSFSAGLMTA
jgi:hypothetical protein